MFIPKDDKLRHRILEILTEKIESYAGGDAIPERFLNIPIADITTQLKITEDKFYGVTCVFIPENEILFRHNDEGHKCVQPGEKTATSYYSKKYIKAGENYGLTRTKDYLNIGVSSIAIVSAIATGIVSITSIRNSQLEIESLRKEISTMKEQSQPEVQQKVYPVQSGS